MKIPIIDSQPFSLSLDLDGVFADFNKRVYQISGKFPHQFDRGMWKVIMVDKKFFESLDMMPDAHYLWEYVKQYNDLKFLTGAPPGERFRNQKKEWVARKFGTQYETIVLPKKDKQLYSGPNRLLIDDTPINIDQWVSKGGLGVLHKDVRETIEIIEELRKGYKL